MTRFSRFGTDYTDPSAYPGTAAGLTPRGGSVGRTAAGGVLRATGAVFIGIVAVVVAWHLLGFVIGTLWFAVKLAVIIGVLAALVTAFRRFR